ncbi:MAG: hypothetical protein KDH96_03055 [Candidatus Riesia sp.]|nr:hypothetical protein [Candidatus Riesia sp.]
MKQKFLKVSYNIAEHDLEVKRKQARQFVEKGLSVKIQMRLHGRQRTLYDNPLEKLKSMFEGFKIVNSWGKNDNYYLFIS